ncbi:MAG TPA: AMP-binding protein, partial [Thermoanaerobaculia bacterium]|nr:AMP-binding protein [Thermoanaerobaculia bacterium]
FDLHLSLAESAGRLNGGFEYDRALFDAATVERMAGHLATLLAVVAARPGMRLSEVPLLPDCERHQLLLEWNDRPGAPGQGGLLHERFEAQAEQAPDAVALVCSPRRLSYRELDERASRAAARLRVGPEDVVALEGERSPEMVIELLGILKAGAAWLPIDPRQPRARLREALTPRPPLPPPLAPSPGEGETVAYVLYTSGSTGRPKGVVVPQRAVMALADWAYETFSEEEMSGVLASTSIGFDLSVFELLVPLSRGGKVVLVEDALALLDLPEAGEVTLLNTVPSVLTELLRAGAVPPSVGTICLAGEPLPGALARQVQRLPGVKRLLNLYGPTEDTVYSTAAHIDGEREPPIGRPIPGSYTRVLDFHLSLAPAGVPGELCLGGAGLARGYLGRPDLTAERFVPDPFAPGLRLYRTGDRVRQRPDGTLEYLGRLDTQVKIRGVRIEPGEVEAALVCHPQVRAAAVLALPELTAFLAADPGISVRELRDFAAGLLPAAMIPSSFTLLPELPRTANGKVDRRALVARGGSAPEGRSFVPPEGDIERAVAEVWQRVLGRERVGALDNFFELGGDSLKTIRVVIALRGRGLEATVRDLFHRQTVRDLARGLKEIRPDESPAEPPEPYELGPSQEWFFAQPWLRPDRWAMVRGRHSATDVDPELFRRACGALLRRHPILNAVFPTCRQIVLRPPTDPPVEEHDLAGLSDEAQRRFVDERAEALVGSLRLDEGPLLRLALFRLGGGRLFVLFVCHHLVCDEVSVEILTDDFLRLYRTLEEGSPEPPPARDLFRDHVLRLRQLRESGGMEPSLRFWREALPAGLPRLPVDARDAPNLAAQKARRTVTLGEEETAGLERIARERFGTGLYALFFGVAARAVALWAGTDEAVLIEIHHGRDPEEGL